MSSINCLNIVEILMFHNLIKNLILFRSYIVIYGDHPIIAMQQDISGSFHILMIVKREKMENP